MSVVWSLARSTYQCMHGKSGHEIYVQFIQFNRTLNQSSSTCGDDWYTTCIYCKCHTIPEKILPQMELSSHLKLLSWMWNFEQTCKYTNNKYAIRNYLCAQSSSRADIIAIYSILINHKHTRIVCNLNIQIKWIVHAWANARHICSIPQRYPNVSRQW